MMISQCIDLEATGKNLCRLREQHGYTVRTLQRYLNLAAPQAIYKWERGAVLPSEDNLRAMAELFCVSVKDIVVYDFPSNVIPFPDCLTK